MNDFHVSSAFQEITWVEWCPLCVRVSGGSSGIRVRAMLVIFVDGMKVVSLWEKLFSIVVIFEIQRDRIVLTRCSRLFGLDGMCVALMNVKKNCYLPASSAGCWLVYIHVVVIFVKRLFQLFCGTVSLGKCGTLPRDIFSNVKWMWRKALCEGEKFKGQFGREHLLRYCLIWAAIYWYLKIFCFCKSGCQIIGMFLI